MDRVGLFVCMVALFCSITDSGADETNISPVVILDTTGFWRMHHTLEPPVVVSARGTTPVLLDCPWLNAPTPGPAADWRNPGFDDGTWVRDVALRFCKTPYLARLCLRGKFEVTDPERVKGLALTVVYRGGALIHVNGHEIARAHLPSGATKQRTLAEAYPVEASITPEGALIGGRNRSTPEVQARLALRDRTLDAIPIPPPLLRKGVNVLSIEVLRAPYDQVHEALRQKSRSGDLRYTPQWNTCEVRSLQLAARTADGLVPNATRPKGLQVWNSDLMTSDFDMDFGDPNEPVSPVRIVGVHNGEFCGKFVVGSTAPIRGLKIVAGDMMSGHSKILASAVRVRYAIPWGDEYAIIPYSTQLPTRGRIPCLLGALQEEPSAAFPVLIKEPSRRGYGELHTPHQPEAVSGAVVPVWLTIRIPTDAAPGTYNGIVQVQAVGEKSRDVPVELKVVDWTLPASQDYRTWTELIQSPDTLSVHYKVDPWSDQHFALIERSMRHIGRTGSRVLHVPLLAQTNYGNEESMVRWIRKGQGEYDYDFTIMDRYLDMANTHMGRPSIVAFTVWEIYLLEEEKFKPSATMAREVIDARKPFRGKGPLVTMLDAADGNRQTVFLPPLTDPLSKPLWQPLLQQIRARMRARGIEDTMRLGILSDITPTKEEVAFFSELLPGVPWMSHAHHGWRFEKGLHDLADVRYQVRVWNVDFASSTPEERVYGWKNPDLLASYERSSSINSFSPAHWAHMTEMNITGTQRGVGRVGADFWPIGEDGRSRNTSRVCSRYPHSSWRNLDLYSCLLAPGPNGPVATPHFEYFREGVQHCEARIFIEEALTDETLKLKLGPDLAKRCQDALDERQHVFLRSKSGMQMQNPDDRYATDWRSNTGVAGQTWFIGSGWQQRSEQLYTLAEAVTRATGRLSGDGAF